MRNPLLIDATHAEIKSNKISEVLVLYYFAKKNVTRNMVNGVVIHLLGTVPF